MPRSRARFCSVAHRQAAYRARLAARALRRLETPADRAERQRIAGEVARRTRAALDRAAAEGRPLQRARAFPAGSVEYLMLPERIPPGCTTACPCRQRVLDPWGYVRQACLESEGRLTRLRVAAGSTEIEA